MYKTALYKMIYVALDHVEMLDVHYQHFSSDQLSVRGIADTPNL